MTNLLERDIQCGYGLIAVTVVGGWRVPERYQSLALPAGKLMESDLHIRVVSPLYQELRHLSFLCWRRACGCRGLNDLLYDI